MLWSALSICMISLNGKGYFFYSLKLFPILILLLVLEVSLHNSTRPVDVAVLTRLVWTIVIDYRVNNLCRRSFCMTTWLSKHKENCVFWLSIMNRLNCFCQISMAHICRIWLHFSYLHKFYIWQLSGKFLSSNENYFR